MDQSGLPMELPERQELVGMRPTRPEEARVRRPVCNQVEMVLRDLDSLVPERHPARAIWEFLEGLDLSAFYSSVRAVLDKPGRPVSDPQVLPALWVYAMVDGVGSARRLDRLCREHDVYRWICGGAPVNYHTLADFRTAKREALDDLLAEIVGTLMAGNVVTLKQVAQDGVRVRAGAGAASFHRRSHLEQCLKAAKEQVKRLDEEREPDLPSAQRICQYGKEVLVDCARYKGQGWRSIHMAPCGQAL